MQAQTPAASAKAREPLLPLLALDDGGAGARHVLGVRPADAGAESCGDVRTAAADGRLPGQRHLSRRRLHVGLRRPAGAPLRRRHDEPRRPRPGIDRPDRPRLRQPCRDHPRLAFHRRRLRQRQSGGGPPAAALRATWPPQPDFRDQAGGRAARRDARGRHATTAGRTGRMAGRHSSECPAAGRARPAAAAAPPAVGRRPRSGDRAQGRRARRRRPHPAASDTAIAGHHRLLLCRLPGLPDRLRGYDARDRNGLDAGRGRRDRRGHAGRRHGRSHHLERVRRPLRQRLDDPRAAGRGIGWLCAWRPAP